MKEKITVKIQRDAKRFYIKYANNPEWESINISDLPKSLRALLNTYTSGEYEVNIEAEIYTGI